MIRFKLAEILAARNIKRTVLSKETGISRNTLSSITTNSTEMVKLETIDKICKFLSISPGDFFEFAPVDFEFSIETTKFRVNYDIYSEAVDHISYDFDLFVDVTPQNRKDSETFLFEGKSKFIKSAYEEHVMELHIEAEDIEKSKKLIDILDSLPAGLQSRYQALVRYTVMHEFSEQIKSHHTYTGNEAFRIQFQFYSQSGLMPFDIQETTDFNLS